MKWHDVLLMLPLFKLAQAYACFVGLITQLLPQKMPG